MGEIKKSITFSSFGSSTEVRTQRLDHEEQLKILAILTVI